MEKYIHQSNILDNVSESLGVDKAPTSGTMFVWIDSGNYKIKVKSKHAKNIISIEDIGDFCIYSVKNINDSC